MVLVDTGQENLCRILLRPGGDDDAPVRIQRCILKEFRYNKPADSVVFSVLARLSWRSYTYGAG